ncbi:hypothetical protein H5410_027633 [Solanum commersonii]|uniref:Uncharacterized protein n=1 Tax=Solanum commersonii TaxID=4109 RepID=A0A9J5Z1T7_SOLCO|nr:hypothetical protein H5410_027633 [Solanum commersonii]
MILKSNGYKELNLDLNKGRRTEKIHFQLGEDEILLSSSLPKKPSPNLRENIPKNSSAGKSFDKVSRNHRLTQLFGLWCSSSPSCTSLQHRRALCQSLGDLVLLRGIIQ